MIHISKFWHTNLSNHVKFILMIPFTLNMIIYNFVYDKIIFFSKIYTIYKEW